MKGKETILISIVLTLVACQSLPYRSSNGEVIDIAIRDRLSAATIQVNAGDEIRWREAAFSLNENAGLCFDKPGTIRYIVRMQSELRSGEITESGQFRSERFQGIRSRRTEPALFHHRHNNEGIPMFQRTGPYNDGDRGVL